MAAKAGAGDLIERVGFERPVSGADGAGGVQDGFQEWYSCRAQYIHLRGGESVMAGRLEGRHPLVMRIRASSTAREITTEWQVRDKRSGKVFNIRDITPSDDRLWLDVLVEGGVAA